MAQPGDEHRWLRRMIGAWAFDGEATGAEPAPQRFSGTETVRGLGELWIVAEGEGALPEGGSMNTLTLIGYDPAQGVYVGSFAASMMTHLWHYRGSLDQDGARLVLRTEGPDMETGEMAAFEDSMAIVDADHRVLTSRMQGRDGQWRQVCRIRYARLPD